MKIFTLTKDALVMGDKDEKYGYTMWANTDQGDVMFNTQKSAVLEGTQITAEETVDKVSKAGNPYLRLKKVKIAESGAEQDFGVKTQQTASVSLSEQTGSQLDRIEAKIDKLLGINKDATEQTDEIKLEDIPY